jgi:hypothetical protein
MKVKHSAKAIGASGAARAALMRLVTATAGLFHGEKKFQRAAVSKYTAAAPVRK